MAKKAFKPKSFEERQKEISELTDSLHERVNSYFSTPEQMKEYLEFKSKFYQYSNRNMALIDNQFRGAEAVGNFGFWKKHGFSVNKGEKAIKIFKPNPFEYFRRGDEQEKIPVSKATAQEKQMIQNKQIKVYTDQYFSITHVFDISQTNATADDLPKLFPNRWLEGNVENYALVYRSLEKVAEINGIKIVEPYEELGLAKGVSYTMLKEVALNPRNSELQNVKTLIHELAHATLHTAGKLDQYNHNEREFQAELTAFTVASYLGLDTSEYSLKYINEYSKDETQFSDKIRLLDEVKSTAQSFIQVIETELLQERNLEENKLEQEQNNEPKVIIEWSEIEGLKPNTTMTFKEANEYLLNANKELQTSFDADGTPLPNDNKYLFEVDTKYKVVDLEGNVFSPRKFTMSKMENAQFYPSIANQIYIEEPQLYKKLSETYDMYGGEKIVYKDGNTNDLSLEAIQEKYGHLYLIQNQGTEAKLMAIREMSSEEMNRLLTDRNYTNLFNHSQMQGLTDDKEVINTFNSFDEKTLHHNKAIITDKEISEPIGYVVWSEGLIDKNLMPLKELDAVLAQAEYDAKHRIGYEKTRVHYMYPDANGEMVVKAMDRLDIGDGSFKSIVDELKDHPSHRSDLAYMQSKWDIQADPDKVPALTKEHVQRQIEHYVYEELKESEVMMKENNTTIYPSIDENEWLLDKFSSLAVEEGHFTKDEIEMIREKTTDKFFEDKVSREQEQVNILEHKFTSYQKSLQEELKGNVSEESIVERLNLENEYHETKSELIKTGIISKENVGVMEEKVVAALQKNQSEKQLATIKNVQELER
jgi:Zn-dependent peptidase ImmA (M78 family)